MIIVLPLSLTLLYLVEINLIIDIKFLFSSMFTNFIFNVFLRVLIGL